MTKRKPRIPWSTPTDEELAEQGYYRDDRGSVIPLKYRDTDPSQRRPLQAEVEPDHASTGTARGQRGVGAVEQIAGSAEYGERDAERGTDSGNVSSSQTGTRGTKAAPSGSDQTPLRDSAQEVSDPCPVHCYESYLTITNIVRCKRCDRACDGVVVQ